MAENFPATAVFFSKKPYITISAKMFLSRQKSPGHYMCRKPMPDKFVRGLILYVLLCTVRRVD